MMTDPIVPPVDVTPTTLKVGDKEYTPEEIQKLETARDYFQTESQKAKETVKTLEEQVKANEELKNKADDVISGKISASELTEQEKEDMAYMSKLGFIPKSTLDEVVAKVKEDTTKEVEEKLTKKETLARVEKEIDSLATQHTFIDKEKLKEYMSDRAKGGTVLSPEEAVTLLYKDHILANGIKPVELPGVIKDDKGKITEPTPKILPLGSREMGERIAERLNKIN